MPILSVDIARFHDRLPLPWFKECRPKILVVTDGLNYLSTDAFGLTDFVATLRASSIHSMTPLVITAQFNPDPAAALAYDATAQHIGNFKFADATHGLRKSRYDVVFILSSAGGGGSLLAAEAGAMSAITAFMQAGGGVFATGDHADLGAGMCRDIPRVRAMRLWSPAVPPAPGVPSAGGIDRLTTNLPGRSDVTGSNDDYEFNDQSDQFPQRLYVNFRSAAGGVGAAHPLLQMPATTRAIEVFPDHPHEGECVVPTNLAAKMADGVTDEWPVAAGGGARVAPEMAALTVSHGNAFPGKEAVTPRSFIAVCAYDGQRANVGRVVTDATWHHFININVKPGMSLLAGRDLADIRQYFKNLAVWLMPKHVRRCLRYPWVLTELMRYPLFEEIVPIPRPQIDGPRLREVGELVQAALRTRHTQAEIDALVADALEDGMPPSARQPFDQLGAEFGRISARDTGLAALGSLTLALADRFNQLKDEATLDGEKAFAEVARAAAAHGVKLYLTDTSKRIRQVGEVIDSVIGERSEQPRKQQAEQA